MTEKLDICRKALDKFGIVAQMGMMHEEMGELSAALEHYKRGRCQKEDVVTEIADVMIVAAQMALYFGKEEVDAEVDRKLERLEKSFSGERGNEDEKIRREIIDFICWEINRGSVTKKQQEKSNSWLSWLEKQKENPKNDSSISTDCASSAKCENEHNKPGGFVFELRQIISRHWYADMYSEYVDDEEGMAREVLSLCEKQKEQKPPIAGNDFGWIDELKQDLEHPEELDQKVADVLKQRKGIRDLGWTEEDEEHLDSIIESYKELLKDYSANHGVDYIPYNTPVVARTVLNDIKFLKSLRSQSKQEWSAEDERMLTGIIERGSAQIPPSEPALRDEQMAWLMNRLKSLRSRPNWKPSDRQLGALLTAFGDEKKAGSDVATELRNLYYDLKKLM